MDGRQRRLPPVSGPLGHEYPDGPQDARLRGTVPTETHQRRAKLLQIHRLLHLNWSVNATIAVLKYLKYPAVLLLAFLLVPLCFLNYHVTFFVNYIQYVNFNSVIFTGTYNLTGVIQLSKTEI